MGTTLGAALGELVQPTNFRHVQQVDVFDAILRLLAACLLGGLVGLGREIRRRSAGVRTNLLIAMGCAFFTLLSVVLAGETNPDKGRVASNIVQGIGFLGAGLILHNQSRISGLTSAASVFAVASIGMACGAGLFAAAAAATAIVIVALEAVGLLERRAGIKRYPLVYEVRGADQDAMLHSILDAMDGAGERLSGFDLSPVGALKRVSFTITTTMKEHRHLRDRLLAEPAIDRLLSFSDPEED